MALTLSFGLNVICAVPTGSITQPSQAQTFQIVAPWGQTVPCYSLEEAINSIWHKGGTQFSGNMGQYFTAQTLNGATGSGATAFASANALESTQ